VLHGHLARRRASHSYGYVLLMIGGGITAAVLAGGSHAVVAANRDAAPDSLGSSTDAAVVAAAIDAGVSLDAVTPDAAATMLRDAGARPLVRPKRVDAGEPSEPDLYNHR